MPKYRKKPVVAEMFQYTGDLDALRSWGDDLCERNENIRTVQADESAGLAGGINVWCEHHQSMVWLATGGWVVAEADGNGYYPVAAEDFVRLYEQEPVTDA